MFSRVDYVIVIDLFVLCTQMRNYLSREVKKNVPEMGM